MNTATTSPPRDGARAADIAWLWELTPSERVAAMRAGALTLAQCAAWASRYPEQVPLVNGEFEYIALRQPEVAG
jgi:hypothetical protein